MTFQSIKRQYTRGNFCIPRLIALFFILLAPAITTAFAQQQSLPPNIIFILADDLGYGDLGSYGQKRIKTPVLDKLASEGKRYTQFYAGSTVCAPSRASLMTGHHTGRSYIRGNGEIPLRQQDTILSQVLKRAGYTTGMVGKWGLGLPGTAGVPEKKGWDYFSGFLHHREGHFQLNDSIWTIIDGVSTKIPVAPNTYTNELFTQNAIDFIEDNKNNPFFLYVSFTLPHAELKVPDRYLKQYLDSEGNSLFEPEKPQPEGLHYGGQPFPKAAYAAMVSSIDDYTSWILDKLDELGIAENTLVIFASDNGTHREGGRTLKDVSEVFHSSGPLRGVKRDLYEGGIRVPFIVRWPGHIEGGTTSEHLGAFWDVLPTFADLVGEQAPKDIDGLSFLPDLLGRNGQQQHEALYWEFTEGGFKQAVRVGDWKAIRFYNKKEPKRTELYYLKDDVGETTDRAAEFPEKVREMENMMAKQRTSSEHPAFRIR